MATYKLNIGRIRGCPPARKVQELMERFGLPESEEYGVLDAAANDDSLAGRIVRRVNQTVQHLDYQARQVVSAPIEKVTCYPFSIVPRKERLEVYAGAAGSLKELAAFLTSALGLSVVIDPVELDVLSCIEKLAKSTQRFQLRSVRVSDFSHNSYMIGPYAPRFADSDHGKDFLQEYAEAVTAASVKFQLQHGRSTATLAPTACFSYSCHEDDTTAAKAVLRGLI